jgi:hypothetical protein
MSLATLQTEIGVPFPAPRIVGTALAEYFELDLDPHWPLAGVTFPAFGCDFPVGEAPYDLCSATLVDRTVNIDLPDVDDEDEDADTGACVEFKPFTIPLHAEVSVVRGWSEAQLRDWARRKIELVRSAIVAREVLTGALATSEHSFIGEADTVTGLDTTPAGALGAVENGLAAKLGNGLGMIHVTPGLLTDLLSDAAVFMDGGSWKTANGHTVVADAGYTGGAPSTGTVTAGAPWIYGSGPVGYKTAIEDRGERIVNISRNKLVIVGAEWGVVAFEPCTVVAALVDTTP